MQEPHFRTYAEVDPEILSRNFDLIRSQVRPDCRILSIIKADAYGHGAIRTAQTLAKSDYFGVACLDEALDLRENGITKPILILGYTSPENASLLARNQLTQCAFSAEYLRALDAELRADERLRVHLKIDTGMSRLGFYARDDRSIETTIHTVSDVFAQTKHLDYEGIFTHFTSSELPDRSETDEQFGFFTRVLNGLSDRGITFPIRHCANSAATLLYPEMHLDMCRPGLILYGYLPDGGIPDPGLQPALRLKTRVAQVHTIRKGDAVSYNRTFRAERDMDIATICIGYADGLLRSLSNGGPVLINGHRTKILGRICMDQCIVDVTGVSVRPGDTAVLIGTSGGLRLTAEDLAEYAGTISYEILCAISRRVPRVDTDFAAEGD